MNTESSESAATPGAPAPSEEQCKDLKESVRDYVKYADIVTGFTVVQSLAFAFKMGDGGAFLSHLLVKKGLMVGISLAVGVFYLALVVGCQCAISELRARAKCMPDPVAAKWERFQWWVRYCLIGLAVLGAAVALAVQGVATCP